MANILHEYSDKLNIFTDHRNLTFKTLNTERVLRWGLFLDEIMTTMIGGAGTDMYTLNVRLCSAWRVHIKTPIVCPVARASPSEVD